MTGFSVPQWFVCRPYIAIYAYGSIRNMRMHISKDFKILSLVILAFLVIGVLFLYAPKYFSYTRLADIAQTLPDYQEYNLSSGARSSVDCYSVNDSSSCWALVTQIKTEHDTDAETEKFIKFSQENDIKWPEYGKGDRSISSDVFTRDGRNYQIYILHETDSTTISLLEY